MKTIQLEVTAVGTQVAVDLAWEELQACKAENEQAHAAVRAHKAEVRERYHTMHHTKPSHYDAAWFENYDRQVALASHRRTMDAPLTQRGAHLISGYRAVRLQQPDHVVAHVLSLRDEQMTCWLGHP